MDFTGFLIDFVLHLDIYLSILIQASGVWVYSILFLIVFSETGLVVFPFLPGDSLLFAAGAFAGKGDLNVFALLAVLIFAAVLGDSVNYWIGSFVGRKAFGRENARFFKKKHLEKTKLFYEKHGGKTIIIARFVPIIRTFAPFVAGIGRMNYKRFLAFNVIGGIAWVAVFVLSGFLFGNTPVVRENFTLAVFAIIIVSLIPAIVEVLKHWKKKPQKKL